MVSIEDDKSEKGLSQLWVSSKGYRITKRLSLDAQYCAWVRLPY